MDDTARGHTFGGWFDGNSTHDIKRWLRFWRNPKSDGHAEKLARENPRRFGGMAREDHIRMLVAEINARTA